MRTIAEGTPLARPAPAREIASPEKEREDWRSMIAHDLRGPLCSIYGVLETMRHRIDRGGPPERDREMISIGLRNCLRMTALLDLYLDVSKFDAGRMPVEIEKLDFSSIARRCAEEQSLLARERRIALAVDVPDGLSVLADAELLPRVILNLLGNALKFTPEGGRVRLSARGGGNGVELSLDDTGPGIAAEELPRLFDRYHQAKAKREGKVRGTGLGLAFCRLALTAMKGDIRVESKPGEGSRFIVRLPSPHRRGGRRRASVLRALHRRH
jgi:signal transduction histidine kinase